MGERDSYAPGTFCWADLGTTDADAAKAFYTRVFGWEAVDAPAGDAGTYTTFRLDGRDVAALYEMGEEDPYEGEIRELVPSPRDVPTYDHKPEMSAREAADAFVGHWKADEPAFAIINFANPDMVGHTGDIDAAVKAVETVDACLGDVVEAVRGSGGACVITADHGNADHMLDEDGSVNTAHSLNPVPFVVTADGAALDGEGILADVAPTVLELMEIDQPEQMTGRSLLA